MILGKGLSMPDHGPVPGRPVAVFTRSFRAGTGAVRRTLIAMTDRLAPHVSKDHMGRAELVLAELLNNVAQHGQPDLNATRPMVHLSVVAQTEGLSCSVSDDGGLLPRICLNHPAPNPADHPEGGFGWFLIGHLTQQLVYFRENDRNFVAFTIPREGGPKDPNE